MEAKAGYANIWTYQYYQAHHQEVTGNQWGAIDLAFRGAISPFIEEFVAKSEINAYIEKYQIFQRIEEYSSMPKDLSNFPSKFTNSAISFAELSSGCKSALAILWYGCKKTSDKYFVDISETGPNALMVCVEMLEEFQNVIGVLNIPTDIAGSYDNISINLDGEFISDWYTVIKFCGIRGIEADV